MSTVSIRELANNASAVVDDVARTRRPTVVTKHGKPDAAVGRGERGLPLDEALAAVDAEGRGS